MKKFLLICVAVLFAATTAWAADDVTQGLRNGKRPQLVPLVKKTIEPQETRMPGRMEIVPTALRGQTGQWVSPFNFSKNGTGNVISKPLAIPFDDNSRFTPTFVNQSGRVSNIEVLGDVVNFATAMNLGATYVRNMQAAPPASGWDWATTEFTNQGGSYGNLYGVCALGMYYAYVKNGNAPTSLFTGMTNAADAIVAFGTSDARDASAMKFLMLYNDLPSVTGTSYKDAAKAKYDWLISNRGGTATTLAEYIRNNRVSQGYPNGIIGWDVGAYAVAAQMLYNRFGGTYNADADAIAEVLYQDAYVLHATAGFDLVRCSNWDANPDSWWFTLGVSGLLDAFFASNSHTSEIPGLVTILMNSRASSGAFCDGPGIHVGDESWQATAYCVMALSNVPSSTYAMNTGAYYLAATQHTSGGWVYGNGYHYPEVGAECTSALSMASAPTELWVDDNYNSTNTGGHVWGYDAFSNIQSAIDASMPGSIINVYPGNYSETASGRTVLASTPGAMGPYQFGLFIDIFHNGITIRGVNSGGTPIANYSSVAAFVQTNATDNFGPDGVWVEGDNVTISGLSIWQNVAAVGWINKTITCIGNNFALKFCQIVDADGGSMYMDDWRFDTGTNTSYVQSYTIEGNLFQYGASVDICSGAGFSGAVSGRQIINNTFTAGTGIYWALVSFNGSGTGVPWFVHQVGGAIISGNNFSGGEQYIRSRGTVPFGQFNWADYWNNNTFDKKVMFGTNPPTTIGEYSYPNSYGTFNNVRRIGAILQQEIDHASSGDIVLAGPGTYTEWNILVDKAISLQGAGVTSIIDATSDVATNEQSVMNISLPTGNVIVDGFKFLTGNRDAIWATSNTNPSSVITISHNEIVGNGVNTDPFPGENFGLIAGYGMNAKVVFDHNVAYDFWNNVILFERQHGATEITNNAFSSTWGIFYMTYNGEDIITLQKMSHNSFDLAGPDWYGSAGIAFESSYHTVGRTGKYTNIEITDNSFTNMNDAVNYRRGVSLYNAALGTGADGEIVAPVIKRNTISGSAINNRGIQLIGYVTNADIQNNAISGLDYGIYVYTGPNGVTAYPVGTIVSRNSITGCISNAIRWEGTGDFNASGNWWGAVPIWGSIFFGSVDYTPWCQLVGTYNNPGFTPNMSQLMVEALSPQTGLVSRIQEGINMVSGSTVNVAAGTYTEQVLINVPVNLLGPNAGIDPNTGLRVAEAIIQTDDLNIHQAVLIQSSDVTLDGFILYGPNGSVKDIGAVGLDGTGARTNVHIQNNKIYRTTDGTDWNGDAVRLDPPSTADASIYIEHNLISAGGTGAQFTKGNNAVTLADNGYKSLNAGTWVVGNPDRFVLKNNVLSGHGKLYVEGIGILIEDNTFNGNWGPIEARGVKDMVINHNTMSGTVDVGIFAWSPATGASGAGLSSDISITNNTISATLQDAPEMTQDFTDKGSGIILGGITNATVTGNVITNNLGSGIVISGIGYQHFDPSWGLPGVDFDPINNVFHSNNISGNTLYGMRNRTMVLVDAKYNWWGDASGPLDNKSLPGTPNYNNPGGLGNAVTSYVDYQPWNFAPTYYNTPATAYDIYLSSSTAAAAGIIYPNTSWGVTSYEPNDWDFTAPIDFYIVPESGSKFGACDITIEWDNSLYSFGSVTKVGGLFESHFFEYNTLGSTSRVTINASTSDYSNFTTTAGNYIAKVTLNLLKPGYAPLNFKSMDFRYFDALNPPLGVYVTGKNASVKSYLGDVATLGDESTGDGLVELADLNTWTNSYWSGVPGYSGGMDFYQVKCDVGPTSTTTIYGLPTTDGKIQFEDLVIFAMSYGASGNHLYPKLAPVPETPVEVSVGKPIASANETLVPIFISGAVQDLRAASLILSGSFSKFISAEKGDLLTSYTTPVMLLSRSEAGKVYVDLSLAGFDVKGLSEEGQLVMIRFEGKANVNVTSADLRNTANSTMLVKLGDNTRGIPTEFALSQNYPNPFNPSTLISYQVPVQAAVEISVFNSIGEKVATLINEVKEPGYYEATWNAASMPSGVYFFRINAGEFSAVKKMMLMK